MTAPATRKALLDAAERLFARKGLHITTLRDVTRKARANLASVHYHFGSKNGLVRAVLVRRAGDLNRGRLLMLDEAEAAAGRRPVPLETVMRAFVAPTARLCREFPDFMKLVGRVYTDPDARLRAFWLSQFEEVVLRFRAAITRCLPDVPVPEIFWRMHFIVGALIHTWISYLDVPALTGGLCPVPDDDELVARFTSLSLAVLRAPRHGKGHSR